MTAGGNSAANADMVRSPILPKGVPETSAMAQPGTNAKPRWACQLRPDNTEAPSNAATVASPRMPEIAAIAQPFPVVSVGRILDAAGSAVSASTAPPQSSSACVDRREGAESMKFGARRSAPLNPANAIPTSADASPAASHCQSAVRTVMA